MLPGWLKPSKKKQICVACMKPGNSGECSYEGRYLIKGRERERDVDEKCLV